jgi:hypothetical protein
MQNQVETLYSKSKSIEHYTSKSKSNNINKNNNKNKNINKTIEHMGEGPSCPEGYIFSEEDGMCIMQEIESFK